MLRSLIDKFKQSQTRFLVAQLNARLQPIHRGEFFEDPLDQALSQAALGEVSGGGTLQGMTGEIEFCDIEIQLSGPAADGASLIIEVLEKLGAPKDRSCTSKPSPAKFPSAGSRAWPST